MKKTKPGKVDVKEKPPRVEAAKPAEAGDQNRTAEMPDPLVELRAKVEKLEDSLLRAKADYQNAQRRWAIERAEAIRYANADLLRSLIGVIDDFDRSLAAARSSDNLKAVVEGVRLVYQNLVKALQAEGLERIDALHKPFDPSVHEAVMQRPSPDHPAGTVIEEIAKGYRLRDRVLRPAKVVVSKAPDGDSASTPSKAEERTDRAEDSEAHE